MSIGRCEDHVEVKKALLTVAGRTQEVDIYGAKLDWADVDNNKRDSGNGRHSECRYFKCHIIMPPGAEMAAESAKAGGAETVWLEISGREPFRGTFARLNYFEGTNLPQIGPSV
jgi:hypothetical protein